MLSERLTELQYGLTSTEAALRLRSQGYNVLPSSKPRSTLALGFEVVKEPMFALLLACAILYTILGDVSEAILLGCSVFVVIGITFAQERKTERALQALRDLSSPRAIVIRDGQRQRIAGRDVVPGDLLVLAEGDRVAADAVLLSGLDIQVDESLLTGESVAVVKVPGRADAPMERPGGDLRPFVYSGTLVVKGSGVALVKSTGPETEMGKIGKSLGELGLEATPLQKSTSRLVRIFAIFGLLLCVLVAVAYGYLRGAWLKGLLAGLTMAISMLPEEFPVVLSIFLAIGAWRIAQKNVLTRRVPAIETLGAATTLCVDKTGTLTENRMKVRKLGIGEQTIDVGAGVLPAPFAELVRFGALASEQEPFDPTEQAIHALEAESFSSGNSARDDWQLVRRYALTPDLLAVTQVWRKPQDRNHVVAAKGAPEAVADLCHLDKEERELLRLRAGSLASQGLRVLAVAKQVGAASLPEVQQGFTFTLVGLIGLEDPVRQTVPSAIQECYSAGIRVIMVTGDHPETARSIGRQIGLRSPEEVMTGREVAGLNREELTARIRSVNIFARVMPEHKLRLVEALKASGEIVAMTGDGVNDAPALKSAHIGIAMGKRGSDVAREAASLVLLDDDFSSIVNAIRLGRRIYVNLKDAMAYAMAVHVPIAGLSLVPVLMGWPLVLMPIHVLFLELVIDPACSIVFEVQPEEPGIMRRRPRDPGEPLFTRRQFALAFLQGGSVLAVLLAILGIANWKGRTEFDARALTYTTLIIANLGLILTNLSRTRTIFTILRSPTKAVLWTLAGVLSFLGVVLFLPSIRLLFRFSALSLADLAMCLGAGILSIAWFEAYKIFRARKH